MAKCTCTRAVSSAGFGYVQSAVVVRRDENCPIHGDLVADIDLPESQTTAPAHEPTHA